MFVFSRLSQLCGGNDDDIIIGCCGFSERPPLCVCLSLYLLTQPNLITQQPTTTTQPNQIKAKRVLAARRMPKDVMDPQVFYPSTSRPPLYSPTNQLWLFSKTIYKNPPTFAHIISNAYIMNLIVIASIISRLSFYHSSMYFGLLIQFQIWWALTVNSKPPPTINPTLTPMTRTLTTNQQTLLLTYELSAWSLFLYIFSKCLLFPRVLRLSVDKS